MSATTMTDRAAAPRYNRNVVDAFRAASSRRNGGDAGVPPPDFDGGSGGVCDHNCDSAHLAITEHGVHGLLRGGDLPRMLGGAGDRGIPR